MIRYSHVKLDDTLDKIKTINTENTPLYFGRVKITHIKDDVFRLKTLENKMIGRLEVPSYTTEKIIKIGIKNTIFDIVCTAEIVKKKSFYSLIVKEDRDFELIKLKKIKFDNLELKKVRRKDCFALYLGRVKIEYIKKNIFRLKTLEDREIGDLIVDNFTKEEIIKEKILKLLEKNFTFYIECVARIVEKKGSYNLLVLDKEDSFKIIN